MFRFKDYPILEKCHVEYLKLDSLFREKADDDYSPFTEELSIELEKRHDQLKKFEFEVFAKEIYDILKNIKPILRKTTGGEILWEERYGKSFKELTNSDKKVLVGLIEEETIYRLPPEYYTK